MSKISGQLLILGQFQEFQDNWEPCKYFNLVATDLTYRTNFFTHVKNK